MEQIVDLIMNDSSASEISDSIKDALFAKAAEKVDSVRPQIANTFFNPSQVDED